MDTPLPNDVSPPETPILLPAADFPPLEDLSADSPTVLPPWTPPKQPWNMRTLLFLTMLGIGAFYYVLLIVIGGPGRQFALDGLQVLPFVGLALLAYAGERNDACRLLTIISWALLIGPGVLMAVTLTTAAEIDVSTINRMRAAADAGKPWREGFSALFLHGGPVKIVVSAVVSLAAVVAGVMCFKRSVRRAAARILPAFDADSFVHAVALATVVALTLLMFAPLIASAEPPLLAIIDHFADVDFGDTGSTLTGQLSNQNLLLDQVYSFLWLVPMCIVVVGWPLHRKLPEALRRVGFILPQPWHVVFGLGLAALLAVVMPGLVDPAIGWLWDFMHWPKTDAKAFDQLFQSMASPTGAIVIGVTAGIGEELFARGVLQPRLGILIANLFFTSLHALQYNWDAVLSVFIAGMILGLVRKKTNTTTSAIVHGIYDFLLVLASYYQIDPSKWFGW